jgi:hypothetical protein
VKKGLTIIILIFIAIQYNIGQEYKYSIGLRGGSTSGISFRQYRNDASGYGGIVSFYDNGFKITFLKEHYSNSHYSYSSHLYFTKGLGGHAGFVNTDHFTLFGDTYHYDEKVASPVMGIDGLLGMEYRLAVFPLIFGINWKPFFEFSTYRYFELNIWDVGFYAMYSF